MSLMNTVLVTTLHKYTSTIRGGRGGGGGMEGEREGGREEGRG